MIVDVLTPAKVNLGLEVIRKRDDNYHDIATVFQTVSIFDGLRLLESDASSVTITNRIEQIEANLVVRAIDLTRSSENADKHWKVDLRKRIPLAAGLGGASADAAGLLTALAHLESRSPDEFVNQALELGSDVPFLLQGGAALATGRGELLRSLPPLSRGWFVLVTPAIELDRKTARLYGELRKDDFSDGTQVEQVANALQRRQMPNPGDLRNAFSRPLQELLPEIASLPEEFRRHGAPFTALSGAGPTHYTIVRSLEHAVELARSLAREPSTPRRVLIARPTSTGPLVRMRKTIEPIETL